MERQTDNNNENNNNNRLIFVIIFMQGIYSYIPETNHVYRVYNVAALQYLQFMTHVMLFPELNLL
jgi:hypothetical protein